MARSFTESELAQLRQQLLSHGRALFTQQGLKKTSLEELTQPLGIAKSSFYLLFESKEALYLEILAQDAPAITARIQQVLDTAPDARQGIARLLHEIIHELETNVLTRRMLTHPAELQQLAAHASPQQVAAGNRNALTLLVPYIAAKQRAGEIVAGDPVLYARVLSAITLLTLHREQIGRAHYKAVMNAVVELIANGLTALPTTQRGIRAEVKHANTKSKRTGKNHRRHRQ